MADFIVEAARVFPYPHTVSHDDSHARWYVFQSADATASRTYSTEEILELFVRGALSEKTVIHHKFDNRRQAITVRDLVQRTKKK